MMFIVSNAFHIGYTSAWVIFFVEGKKWPPLPWNARVLTNIRLSLSYSDKGKLIDSLVSVILICGWQIYVTYSIIFDFDEKHYQAELVITTIFLFLTPFAIDKSIDLIHTKAQDYWREIRDKRFFQVKNAAKK